MLEVGQEWHNYLPTNGNVWIGLHWGAYHNNLQMSFACASIYVVLHTACVFTSDHAKGTLPSSKAEVLL